MATLRVGYNNEIDRKEAVQLCRQEDVGLVEDGDQTYRHATLTYTC